VIERHARNCFPVKGSRWAPGHSCRGGCGLPARGLMHRAVVHKNRPYPAEAWCWGSGDTRRVPRPCNAALQRRIEVYRRRASALWKPGARTEGSACGRRTPCRVRFQRKQALKVGQGVLCLLRRVGRGAKPGFLRHRARAASTARHRCIQGGSGTGRCRRPPRSRPPL
jgi:hypothetical protein